jgi:ABC-2 type transport system permease protein
MNFFTLTTLELKRYWSKPKNYLSIVFIIAFSIAGALFINGVLGFLIGSLSEVKLNQLSFNQLITSFSIAWLVILLNYCVRELSSIITLDYTTNIDQIVFSKGITPNQYAWSKTLFAVIQCLIFGLIAAAAIIGVSIYYNDPNYILKDQIPSIINFVIFYVIPCQIILALFVSWLSLKLKNKSVMYYTYGLFILGPITISALFANLDKFYPTLSWLDPTGGLVISEITKYFTASELNTFSVNPRFIINRLVWIVGMAIVAGLFFRRFNFEPQTNKDKKIDTTPILFEHLAPTQHLPTQFGQLVTLTRFNLIQAFSKYAIYILTSVMVGYYSFYAFTNFSVEKAQLYPSTTAVILWVFSATLLYVIIYIGYRLSVLYDTEKSTNTTTVLMSKPVSHVNIYLSKIISLWLEVGVATGIVTIAAIVSQYVFLSPVKSPLILIANFVLLWSLYLFIIIFGFLIVTTFNQSKMAFIAVFFLFASTFVLSLLSKKFPFLDSNLFTNVAGSRVDANDFAGIGYGLDKIIILRSYWFALTLVGISIIAWIGLRRDNVYKILTRFIPRTQFLKFLIPVSIIATIGLGYLIKYVEKLHPRQGDQKELASLYYDTYRNDIKKEVPTVTDVTTTFDLYPKDAKFNIKGNYKMVNNNLNNIVDINVDFLDLTNLKNITFDVPVIEANSKDYPDSEVKLSKDLGVRKYRFVTPLEPQQTINMQFEIDYKRNWYSSNDNFENRTIQKNGTFFDNSTLPTIGFNFQKLAVGNFKDNKELKEFTSNTNLNKNLFSNFSNFINFNTTIITESDQIAVAPGTKISEESVSDGRKKYVYNNPKMLFFANILSSRLNVRTENFEGVKIEIYHHPDHTINLDQIMAGAKDTLSYMKTNIGPYPLDYLRIVEFGSGEYAQSFSGTVSIGDNIFIAKAEPNNPKKLNYPYYITAHEVAHQWWGHQVVGAQGKGTSFLTESLAEYSSNRVIAKKYGEEALFTYKKNNLDTYLTSRKIFVDEKNEKQLGEVGYYDQQIFIHYQKGSIVLDNISKVLSEGGLNGLLKKYVEANKTPPPFADYKVLNQNILDATPDVSKPYVTESLNEVAVYDNSITKVNTIEKDGQFISTIDLNLTKKKVVDDKFQPVQFPTQDYTIDTYSNTSSSNFMDGKFISRAVVNVPSGKQQVTITTATRPDNFVLDRDIKYIDTNIKNNSFGGKPQSLVDLLSDPQAITDSLLKL